MTLFLLILHYSAILQNKKYEEKNRCFLAKWIVIKIVLLSLYQNLISLLKKESIKKQDNDWLFRAV